MTTLTINPIDGNDVVNASKAATGVAVSGTTGGVENGQIVTLRLNGNPYYATVSNGAWTTTIPANALAHATLADGTYSVTADVSSFAGDPATAQAVRPRRYSLRYCTNFSVTWGLERNWSRA